MKHSVHRDQVHQDVLFDPLSIALINTPDMQRLGRIYQLGFAHLVYRGGTHTRLSHVMGVSHVAGTLVESLKRNYEITAKEQSAPLGAINPKDFLPQPRNYKENGSTISARWDVLTHLVRWGGLLHDLGHVPLGHTLEDEFSGIYEKHDSFQSPRMTHIWNEQAPSRNSNVKDVLMNKSLYPDSFDQIGIKPHDVWRTVLLICLFKTDEKNTADTTPFSELYDSAINDLQGHFFHQYMADIVADTICADYIDYLQRDTQNVGLDTVKDIRIIQSYFIGKDHITERYRMALSLKDKGGKPRLSICTAAKNMVRHRFDLAEIIYYHKTKVSASAMLAKVFALIDKPNEVGDSKTRIYLDDIDKHAESIFDNPGKAEELQKKNIPNNLLDPFIGDETLLFWLHQRAWEKIKKASVEHDPLQVKKGLLAISLLEGIVERRLYKTTIFIDAELARDFSGATQTEMREQTIVNILSKYRSSPEAQNNRNELERNMAQSSNLPYGSFLVYIPGRKSQAKGIETGSFDDNGLVHTLGTHSAVENELSILNDSYKNLWKVLVFIHPDYRSNIYELSNAVDVFLKTLFPGIDCRAFASKIKKACSFPYISEQNRDAAKTYIEISKNGSLNWRYFESAKYTTTGTIDSKEHAYRTKLMDSLNADIIKSNFSEPGSLHTEINKELETLTHSESYNGTANVDDVIMALDNVARRISKSSLF